VDFYLRHSLNIRRHLLLLRTAVLCEFLIVTATCQATRPPSNPPQVVVVNRPIPVALSEGQGLRFRPLSTGEGISQTTAAAGVQDNLGFLWFATPFGLNRYDGYSFKTYKHEMGNPASLACSNVRTLFKDHAGNLWAACDESLDRFHPRDETFTHYSLPVPGAPGQLVKITSIKEDSRHVLWITTHSGYTETAADLAEREPQRVSLYEAVASLVRGYASIADEAGYSGDDVKRIKKRVEDAVKIISCTTRSMRHLELSTACIVPHFFLSSSFCQGFRPFVLASNHASILSAEPSFRSMSRAS
jgi:hypothetical protein